jgi:hypothetical protein
MTEEQRFIFDLKGWLLLPAVLDPPQIEALKEHAHRLVNDRESLAAVDRYPQSGPAQILLDHPAIVGILEEIIAHSRSESCYGFRCENSFVTIRHAGGEIKQ